MNAQDSIPNSSFESWEIINGYHSPVNWLTNNNSSIVAVLKHNDSNTGNYSVYVSQQGILKSKFPITSHPDFLNVFLKYETQSDSISVEVNLFYNNEIVDSGKWENSGIQNEFIEIQIPISKNAVEVDSAEIIITGPKMIMSSETGVHIDDVKFSIINSTQEKKPEIELNIFPNPVQDYFNVEWSKTSSKGYSIEIYNLSGEMIHAVKGLTSKSITIDKRSLSKGVLIFTLKEEGQIIATKQIALF